ncbi:MAG: enoyl-CoA hydratase/isomerase family protein [Phenylobacterium sp.]|uniref:enoyl-CoA hydratase/isomerase family protein n=1 Tax=Phenylobacterium sp. TaxID=1871053 RepID=UPI00391AA383
MTAVLYEARGPVARITLNRPERLNAINTGLVFGLVEALARAMDGDEIQVAVLAGAGRAFCAGDDLVEFGAGAKSRDEATAFIEGLQAVTRLIQLGPKPVVCAAQGWIVGGAAAWPLNADFLVLAEDAVMFCPEAAHGLFPTGGASILLEERLGPARAAEMLWLGRRIGAAELFSAGVAAAMVPPAELDGAVEALCGRLLALPAASRRRFKAARAQAVGPRLEEALAREAGLCMEAALDAETLARVAAAWS